MKKNARPIETDRNEPSDNSAFEGQKSRISSCAEQIVRANSPGEIAKIAAFLMRDGRDEIEATRTALRLLELAHCALFTFASEEIENGVARCKRNWADYEAIQRAEASIPAYRYETDEKGNLLPVPFDGNRAFHATTQTRGSNQKPSDMDC